MSDFMGLIMQAQQRDGTGWTDNRVWNAIIEACIMVFCVTIIPDMLGMNPRTMTIYDFWKPVLSAMLAVCYAYIRARNIKIEDDING